MNYLFLFWCIFYVSFYMIYHELFVKDALCITQNIQRRWKKFLTENPTYILLLACSLKSPPKCIKKISGTFLLHACRSGQARIFPLFITIYGILLCCYLRYYFDYVSVKLMFYVYYLFEILISFDAIFHGKTQMRNYINVSMGLSQYLCGF